MNTPELFDKIYKKRNQAVWTRNSMDDSFYDILHSILCLSPRPTLEVGCGEGFHAIELAKGGYQVTAIDWSKQGIKNAKKNARKAKVNVDFRVESIDCLSKNPYRNNLYNFIYDWRFFHDILVTDQREKYVSDISHLLAPNGYYLSSSFSDRTTAFGSGSIRDTRVGTICYFASDQELRDLFGKHFHITFECDGWRGAEHDPGKNLTFRYLVMKKK